MSYDFNYKECGYFVSFKGHVTTDELNRANGQIHGHVEFDNHNYQIVDLLEADLSSVTEEDAEFPAITDSIASGVRWGVKVALVARESHTLKIANSYVRYARFFVPKWKFDVFPDNEYALKWAMN